MAFREVRVFEIREVLRLSLRGEGVRATERLAGVDRKTCPALSGRRGELGLVGDGGEQQLTDEFMGSVVEDVWVVDQWDGEPAASHSDARAPRTVTAGVSVPKK